MPGRQSGPPKMCSARVVAPGDEPVGEQHAEERHEERAEQQQELLVAREVDAERDRRSRAPRRSTISRRCDARGSEVLQRHRGRVDVRERLVGLVDRQREQREERADAARGDGREHVGRAADRRMREHEDRAEAELEERRAAGSRGPAPTNAERRSREKRV